MNILKNANFEGQFYLEDQGQGRKFLKQCKNFRYSIHRSSLNVKLITVQKLLHSERIIYYKANFTLKVKVKVEVTSFQTCLRHLDA